MFVARDGKNKRPNRLSYHSRRGIKSYGVWSDSLYGQNASRGRRK
jgi:hypothetical protein